jgi:hypothetical protein
MPDVTIERSADETTVFMSWHDLLAVWVNGSATVENQNETARHAQVLVERWPRGIGIIVVIDDGSPAPSKEVKQEISAMYQRLAPNLRGVCFVMKGHGLQMAMVRGTLIAMNWVARRPYPTSITGDLQKGVNWLHYTLGNDPDRGTVDQFIVALNAAVLGEPLQTLRMRKKR